LGGRNSSRTLSLGGCLQDINQDSLVRYEITREILAGVGSAQIQR